MSGAARDDAVRPRPRIKDLDALLLAALGSYGVLYRLWSLTSSLPAERRTFWSDLAVLPLVVAFVLARRTSRAPGLDPGTRKAWTWIAAAFFCDWTGDLFYFIYTWVWPWKPIDVLHHVAFAMLYPTILIGLVAYPGFLRTRGAALQFGLDAATVLLGGLMVFWASVYGPSAALAGRDVAGLIQAVGYPLGDLVVLLAVSVIVSRHWREPVRLVFLLLLVALLASFVDNAAFGFQLLSGTGNIALADESLYMLAWFFFGASAYAQRRLALTGTAAQPAADPPDLSMNVLPYLAAGIGYSTLFLAVLQGRAPALRGLVVLAMLLTAVVLVRQALTARENALLAAERAAREGEAVLQKSEERYRSVVAALEAGIAIIDESGTIVDCNRAAERILGLPADLLCGRSALDARWDAIREDGSPWPDELRPTTVTLRTGRPVSGSVLGISRPSGDKVWLSVNSQPLSQNGDSRPYGVVVSFIDITQTRAAELLSKEHTTRLDALIANSPLAIAAMDPSGRTEFVNPAFEKIFQYRHDEVADRNIDDFLVPAEPDLRREAVGFTNAVRDGVVIHATTVRRRRDGTTLDVEVFGVPMRDGDRVLGVYGLYSDISHQKQLSEQLRQAQKMEAIGRLAGGIAHDFNNILTAILGYTDILLDQTEPADERHADLEEVRKAAERAAGLTRQLLAFGRKQILRSEVLDLRSLVSNIEEMLRRTIGENIRLETRGAVDLGRVRADPGQIERVILNLAVNARDAMPQGGRLTIETYNATVSAERQREPMYVAPGEYVALAVSDTGTGMDSHVRAHLFEPFFTTKEKGKGTGLGLATVYGIVKQSEGYIWAENATEGGTTLRLYLPRVEEEEAETVEQAVIPVRGGRSETILLVEDEPSLRLLGRRLLGNLGYAVIEADSAEEAMVVARKHSGDIHLALLDVVLPGLSGWELAKILVSERPSLKVLFMSGYTDDRIPNEAIPNVSRHLLHKPFSADVLGQEVREALDR